MKGFIIYSKTEKDLTRQDDYSVMRMLEAAKQKNITLSVISPNQFEMIVTRNDTKSILINNEHVGLPDFVIPRLGSNTTYYAFAVIRQLEHLGIYVCNDSNAIASVRDKLHMHQLISHSNLPTPKTMLVKFPIEIDMISQEIGFPLVIKNVIGTQGKGIYLCNSEEKFIDVMELIYANNNHANIILQEFIQTSRGRDLRAFVLGGRVIGCMRRFSENSFKANFSKGGNVEQFELTPEIEWLATETAKLFNLDIAGIDLLFDKNGFKICEANSAPGFKGMEKVVGTRIAEDILDYISLKLGKLR